jgi:hypothetical protein
MPGLLFKGFSFFFTMILGAIAFAFTAMTYPTTMRHLMAGAEQLRNNLSTFGIPDTYMVWVDILLQGDNLVLMGFIVVARIFVALLGSLFSRSS